MNNWEAFRMPNLHSVATTVLIGTAHSTMTVATPLQGFILYQSSIVFVLQFATYLSSAGNLKLRLLAS